MTSIQFTILTLFVTFLSISYASVDTVISAYYTDSNCTTGFAVSQDDEQGPNNVASVVGVCYLGQGDSPTVAQSNRYTISEDESAYLISYYGTTRCTGVAVNIQTTPFSAETCEQDAIDPAMFRKKVFAPVAKELLIGSGTWNFVNIGISSSVCYPDILDVDASVSMLASTSHAVAGGCFNLASFDGVDSIGFFAGENGDEGGKAFSFRTLNCTGDATALTGCFNNLVQGGTAFIGDISAAVKSVSMNVFAIVFFMALTLRN